MKTTRALDPQEIQALFAAISGRYAVRNRAMLMVGIHMALRASELCGLTVGDVYDGENVRSYITVRGEIAKFGKERTIRIGDEIKGVIDDFIRWKAEKGQSILPIRALFASQKGGHLSRNRLFEVVSAVMKAAGINQSPHCLRKTGATLYYEQSGYDLIATQAFLGHSNPSVTRKYIGITPSQTAAYAARTSRALLEAIKGEEITPPLDVGAKPNTTDNMFGFQRRVSREADQEELLTELQRKEHHISMLTENVDRLTRLLVEEFGYSERELKAVSGGKVIVMDVARRKR